MGKPAPLERRTIRAVRVRRTSPDQDTATVTRELSNYELLERRSRELEIRESVRRVRHTAAARHRHTSPVSRFRRESGKGIRNRGR